MGSNASNERVGTLYREVKLIHQIPLSTPHRLMGVFGVFIGGIMGQEFYRVIFFDKQKNRTTGHYIFTRDINQACEAIMLETPYVNVLSWKQVHEDDLPDSVVVIQK